MLSADWKAILDKCSKTVHSIKGIGKGLITFIKEYDNTGSVKEYEELKSKSPEGILDLLSVRGLGAKKVRTLFDKLNITGLEELENACLHGQISELQGFGKRTEDAYLGEINRIKKARGFILLHKATQKAGELKTLVSGYESSIKTEIVGDLRRNCEIIPRIELLCLVKNTGNFNTEIESDFKIEINKQNNFQEISLIDTSYPCKIVIFSTDNNGVFTDLLIQKTGSIEFIDRISWKTGQNFKKEEEFFKNAGLPYINPEMREKEYFDAPELLRKNSNLSEDKIISLLHFHTNYSDGLNSLEEMVSAAADRGFNYFAVCDHSKTAFYANGLTEERVLKQRKEIERINKNSGDRRLFQGIESDILKDDFLKNFDFLVASIHSNFSLSEDEMTVRIIKALENPYVDVLGHPTGRLLLSRDPYKVDIKKIIDACIKNNVVIEINSNPYRLDLDWRLLYYARDHGALFAINADAHSIEDIDYTKYGIRIAKKAGVQCEEVINYWDINKFKKFLNRKVKRVLN